jgi:hypothetical protein
METNQDAYKLAEGVDQAINNALDNYPITSTNARQWLLFARTLKTSLDIIESKAMKELGLKYKPPGE